MNAISILCLISVAFALLMLYMPKIGEWAQRQLDKHDTNSKR